MEGFDYPVKANNIVYKLQNHLNKLRQVDTIEIMRLKQSPWGGVALDPEFNDRLLHRIREPICDVSSVKPLSKN